MRSRRAPWAPRSRSPSGSASSSKAAKPQPKPRRRTRSLRSTSRSSPRPRPRGQLTWRSTPHPPRPAKPTRRPTRPTTSRAWPKPPARSRATPRPLPPTPRPLPNRRPPPTQRSATKWLPTPRPPRQRPLTKRPSPKRSARSRTRPLPKPTRPPPNKDVTTRDEDMANFTAADVKRLRDQTGAGMMDCKNALGESDGDFESAVELLRVKGVKDAGKRATRTAANGLVTAELDGTDAGVLVELNCETDFVAKTPLFQDTAKQIADAALKSKAADRLTLLAAEARPGATVEQLIEEAGSSLKEKLELGRFVRFAGGYIKAYLHRSDAALPPTLGVLVQLDKENSQVATDLAQQVAAMRPLYTTRGDVPADVVEKERRIAEQITREEGKPEQAIPKIVDGRLNAYFKDAVLTEQVFVKDNKTTVKQILTQNNLTVTGFARFQVGQA